MFAPLRCCCLPAWPSYVTRHFVWKQVKAGSPCRKCPLLLLLPSMALVSLLVSPVRRPWQSAARSIGNIAEGPALREAQQNGCVAQDARCVQAVCSTCLWHAGVEPGSGHVSTPPVNHRNMLQRAEWDRCTGMRLLERVITSTGAGQQRGAVLPRCCLLTELNGLFSEELELHSRVGTMNLTL